jgi:diamine N-acetyltransferase
MVAWDVPDGGPLKGPYFLWRLLIDERHQRLGYGGSAVAAVAELIRHEGGTALLTSCVPGDGGPFPFYQALGFAPTGEMDEHEAVLRWDLSR